MLKQVKYYLLFNNHKETWWVHSMALLLNSEEFIYLLTWYQYILLIFNAYIC